MHGIVRPSTAAGVTQTETRLQRAVQFLRARRYFLALVVLPTLLTAAYLYLVASNQYESVSDFVVRRSDAPAAGNGVGQIFGLNLSGNATSADAHLVEDYLLSHEAVARLRREDRLVERFRPAGADWLSRLWFAQPSPERLLAYYRKQVRIEQDTETGITHVRVHAFAPEDAYAITRKLLVLGEERINALNERTFRDQVVTAERNLALAEAALSDAQTRMTAFRRVEADIDPEGSGKAQIGLVTQLTASLVSARARMQAMEGVISRSSPQYRALAGEVRALEAQIANQSSRLAGSAGSIASSLGDYESLVVRREQAARRYASAATQYEQARAEAARKQLYLIRVVDANIPVRSMFPERGKTVLTLFCSLAIAYAIGWLLVAGVKEHNL